MGLLIGSLLAIILGLFILFGTIGLILDIIGAAIAIIGVVYLIKYLKSRT
jgi:hypothetical protein